MPYADPTKSKEHYRAYRRANRDKLYAQQRAWRVKNPGRSSAYKKAYRTANPEKVSAYGRAWREANPEKQRALVRAWRAANPEKTAAYDKAWRSANPGKRRAVEKAWRASNPEKVAAHNKSYREANLKKIAAYKKAYQRNRYAADPEFRILCNLRRRICKVVRKDLKHTRTKGLLGCTIHELRAHLESRFRPGMAWDNYGPVWHVDHVKPCASFNLLDADQQKACFHYSNLQPLFAQENLRKGSKVYEQLP